MKKETYFLFPYHFLILGFALLVFGFYNIINSIKLFIETIELRDLALNLAFTVIGLIILTTRASFIIDYINKNIIKTVKIFGIRMSDEKIHIPENCKELIIKKKTKRGKGYYKAVIPFFYNLESYDLYLKANSYIKKLISTEQNRASRIAENFKELLGIDFKFE
ncbi:MAG: hypothetical protein JXB17_04710 [Bacteroidales bacterium]|nr:hypothetical protein [Bacteroidales bacterium]